MGMDGENASDQNIKSNKKSGDQIDEYSSEEE